MGYDSVFVLIPCHSLEDFPTDVGETDAAGLLNAFAVAWHPALLAATGVIPTWHRADTPPEVLTNRLILVPPKSDGWLPGGWADHARGQGATVVNGLTERGAMLEAALAPLEAAAVDENLAGDFLALGTCWLLLELLTRQMHYFSNLNEMHLQREAVAAARAALENDADAARSHLKSCFELLLDARERFYPVDCYLLDLCLLIPRLADAHFERTLSQGAPVNVLLTGEDLEAIAAEKPELVQRLRDACERGAADVVGGEWREGPSAVLPVASVLAEFERGQAAFRSRLGRTPTAWGRRRFGLTPAMPQILSKYGYNGALHVVLDDGIYPDAEQSKLRWEGCDGTLIDATSRIPLAGDSAASYLRFVQRMAEAMQQDQTAALIVARWPEVKSPWLDDLRRIHGYLPVLGKFVTFDAFFSATESPGRLSKHEAHEYLSPYFVQAVARQEPDPVSRFRGQVERQQRFEAARWYDRAAQVLTGRSNVIEASASCEQAIAAATADEAAKGAEAEGLFASADAALAEYESFAAEQLAGVVMSGAGSQRGTLLLNPLSFTRRVAVELPQLDAPPSVGGAVKGVQFDGVGRSAVVEVPGSGFVWIPADAPAAAVAAKASHVPLVEDLMIRNEFLEVYINQATGGIAEIREQGRRANRLSQQVAFRFPRERSLRVGDEPADVVKSYYSEMRCRSAETTCNGPALGEVLTTGDVVDQESGSVLAGFRQTVRVWRGRPVVEIDLELTAERMPDGDPWSNYYACRFAWNDGEASVTRSVQQGAHGFRGERFESPHYIEIAGETERTTIVPCGLPFHRKTGPRMIDTILIAAGERARRFRFAIALNQSYPMEVALDALVPPAVVPTEAGPPRAGTSGWFFHLDLRNVQLLEIRSIGGVAPQLGFVVRLLETEGRGRSGKLRCFRTPSGARVRDFQGQTLHELRVDGDAVLVHLGPYEIADVELRFE